MTILIPLKQKYREAKPQGLPFEEQQLHREAEDDLEEARRVVAQGPRDQEGREVMPNLFSPDGLRAATDEATREAVRGGMNAIRNKAADQVALEVLTELARAWTLFPKPMNSAHEGKAVIEEELDELWDEVKRVKPDDDRRARLRKEAIQVAAMAIRFIVELT